MKCSRGARVRACTDRRLRSKTTIPERVPRHTLIRTRVLSPFLSSFTLTFGNPFGTAFFRDNLLRRHGSFYLYLHPAGLRHGSSLPRFHDSVYKSKHALLPRGFILSFDRGLLNRPEAESELLKDCSLVQPSTGHQLRDPLLTFQSMIESTTRLGFFVVRGGDFFFTLPEFLLHTENGANHVFLL